MKFNVPIEVFNAVNEKVFSLESEIRDARTSSPSVRNFTVYQLRRELAILKNFLRGVNDGDR